MKEGYIITFSGKAGSGKDTFVRLFIEQIKNNLWQYAPNYLETNLKYIAENKLGIDFSVYSLAFADTIKSTFARNFNYTEENKSDFRSDLQFFGTEIARAWNENFWVNNVIDLIKMIYNMTPCRIFTISDARFKNELDVGNDLDPLITYNVLVVGEDHRNQMTEEQNNHASERMAEDNSIVYDFTINNTGTLENLEEQAKHLARFVLNNIENEYLSY